MAYKSPNYTDGLILKERTQVLILNLILCSSSYYIYNNFTSVICWIHLYNLIWDQSQFSTNYLQIVNKEKQEIIPKCV